MLGVVLGLGFRVRVRDMVRVRDRLGLGLGLGNGKWRDGKRRSGPSPFQPKFSQYCCRQCINLTVTIVTTAPCPRTRLVGTSTVL